MANLVNLVASGRVNGVQVSKEGTKDISLGFPEGDFEVKLMGVLDDSSQYASFLKKNSIKAEDYQKRLERGESLQFFWAAQPFAGWAIAARPVETKRGVRLPYAEGEGEELWHAYAVAAPTFVKGVPDLGSKDAQDGELAKDLVERTSFYVSHEIKEGDNNRKKHIFKTL